MKLMPQHQKAILLLAQGLNNKDVAEALKLAPETVSRWKADYIFKAELNKLLTANNEANTYKLNQLNSVALDTIEQVMLDSKAPHRDKLAAALKVLEMTKLRPTHIGSTDPRELKANDDLNKQMNECLY